ncbi:MAG: glycine oxidase ThiO [Deltaproteobacteria bacterium]|nr:glycine oxidase ThiO [Deltaproteobacteria bacterium]
MHDVAIIGAGAIGLACALRLAQRDLRVLVVEREANADGAASRAAAGMLSAQLERHASEAMAALCFSSRERHWRLLGDLEALTGIDIDHRELGALRVAFDEEEEQDLDSLASEQRSRGWQVERLSPTEARLLEPMLGTIRSAAWFPGERVLDPPRFVEALRRACDRLGVVRQEGAEVARVRARGDRIDGLDLTNGERIVAGEVVIAGGAWSASIEGTGVEGQVRPIRGQMLELRHTAVPQRILDSRNAYLSPRSDGRVLVGSTLEDVGFERAVTAGAAERLLAAAVKLAPDLARASLARHWCGFRAATRDLLPLLGRTSTGAIAATGHHRNGILLSALTADVVAALVTGSDPEVSLEPFRPDRETSSSQRLDATEGSPAR